jgi:hypothetical protein
MHLNDLSVTQIAFIIFALVVGGGLLVSFLEHRHTTQLRSRFGEAEYERAIAEGGNRRRAEARLDERAKRVASFHLRPLSTVDRSRFVAAWDAVQTHFVDAPAGAVSEADQLVGDLIVAIGYPVADFEQRAADISVDHPQVTQNYRTAHEIALRHSSGQATTEDLRRAMIHFRVLFEDLLESPKTPAVETVRYEPREPRIDYGARPSLRMH